MRVIRNRVVNEWAGRDTKTPPRPDPPEFIGTTRLGDQEYRMPKFAAVLPTPETVGDFEEMCLAAGESAGLVHEIKPAGQIVSEMMTEAERVIVARLVSLVSYRIVYLGTVRNPESFTTTLDDDNNGYDHQPTSLAHRVGNFETPHSRGYSINSIGKAKALTRAATKSAAASGLRLKSF